MKIREHVEVIGQPSVVRLDQLQSAGAEWISSSYYITGEIETHLRALKVLLNKETGCGMFLIGHFGCGKSHFLAYTSQQLQARGLVPTPPDIMPLSLLNYSAAQTLESILDEALELKHSKKDRRQAWDDLLKRHPDGLFLIIDELSEFLRSKPSAKSYNEDLRFLQYLGEWAQDHPFWVLAALQEQIEHSGDIEYDLYRKIKDRYPVRFLLTPAHVKDLIAQRILRKKVSYTPAVESLASELATVYPGNLIDYSLFCKIYPLHPATLELLEEVRDRFSQARGIIDFTLTRLLGNEARGVTSFLEEPWGHLITPDLIVDHFADLFEVQPEFLALAQKALPYFRKNIPALFEKEAQRELAWRLVKLLILVHLSPRRQSLDAEEAAVWLLLRVSSIDPAKNREVLKRILDAFADRGAFLRRLGSRYRLDLEDDSLESLDQLLVRQVEELKNRGESIFEDLVPLLQDAEFNPFSLPRDRWHIRKVRWHFHERDVRIYFGESTPPEEKNLALQIGLPWGPPPECGHYYTIHPNRIEITPDILELGALMQLRERPLPARLLSRIEERIAGRKSWFVSLVRGAYRDAFIIDPSGKRSALPVQDATLASWLDNTCVWILRQTYPSFERFAPGHGPLTKEAYREFMKHASDHDVGSENAPDSVKLIREAYLVPMKLMQRKGSEYVMTPRLDSHELVKLFFPMVDHHPAPARVYEHLSAPVYGLVPDQIHILLIMLLIQGEIDIVKGQHSYRDSYETLLNPLQYEKILPGRALNLNQIRDLQSLCEKFHITAPKQWTVLAQKRAIEQLRKFGTRQQERLGEFIRNLKAHPETEDLVTQAEKVVSWWLALHKGDHELQGFQHFLYEIGSPQRFLEQASEIMTLPDRYEKLLLQSRRFRHLFSYEPFRQCIDSNIAVRMEALPAQPSAAEPDALEAWLKEAESLYSDYQNWYRRLHEDWRKSAAQHRIWSYSPPSVSRSKHSGVADLVRPLEALQSRARALRCAGIDSLDYQAVCRCGFNGSDSPLTEVLDEFDRKVKVLESELALFFQQEKVKSRVEEWVNQNLEMSTQTLSYLEGKAAFPEVQNVPLFDQHLSGLELARSVDGTTFLDFLGTRVYEKSNLISALDQFFTRIGASRLRFRREEAAPRRELLAWCCEMALQHGVPVPAAFTPAEYSLLPEILQPQWVSPKSLQTLEQMGLGEAAIDSILRMLLEGAIRMPDQIPASGPVAAVKELLHPQQMNSVEELAHVVRLLYEQNGRFDRLHPQMWRTRLDELANTNVSAENLESLLNQHTDAQWIVIDCLGVPLLDDLQDVLTNSLPHWKLKSVHFGLVSNRSSTSVFYQVLLDAGLLKSFHKMNAIDNLIHNRRLTFPELARLARAELEIGFRKIVPKLDPALPVVVFGDHGFRLNREGTEFQHGGSSTLERLTPVCLLSSL